MSFSVSNDRLLCLILINPTRPTTTTCGCSRCHVAARWMLSGRSRRSCTLTSGLVGLAQHSNTFVLRTRHKHVHNPGRGCLPRRSTHGRSATGCSRRIKPFRHICAATLAIAPLPACLVGWTAAEPSPVTAPECAGTRFSRCRTSASTSCRYARTQSIGSNRPRLQRLFTAN